MREEREAARRLAFALEGRAADDEARVLASLLRAAAAEARFEPVPVDVERALERARPRLGTRRARHVRPRLALGAAAVAAAVAGAAVAAVLLTRAGGLHIEDDALAALGPRSQLVRVVERIRPAAPGLFRPSTRIGWIDAATGRVLWNQYAGGRRVADTLVERGRVTRYLIEANTAIVGPSCRAFASGCAELVDPLSFYRRALEAGGGEASRTTFQGRRAYRLVLPVQTLPDAVRIEQVATIDAATFLPRRIEWREERPGARGPHDVAIIDIVSIQRLSRDEAFGVFELRLPSDVRIEQRVAPRRPLRLLGVDRLTLPAARRLSPPLLWLPPRTFGTPLTAVQRLRWNAGSAIRLRYGARLTLWAYSRVVPPQILAGRLGEAKTVPTPFGVARFYGTGRGAIVLELERPGRSIAIVAPTFGKEDLFRLLDLLEPLR